MKLISVICHPLLMTTYLSVILLLKVPELFPVQSHLVWNFVLVLFLATCMIPAVSIFSLKLFSRVSNLELTNRHERPLPFLLITVSYTMTSFLFVSKLQIGKPFSSMIVSVTVLIGLLFLITQWFKISIHSTAIWCATSILISLAITKGIMLQNVIYISIILAGLTNVSRLYLGYHQPKEVWSGSILGFCFGFISIYFFG